MDAGRDSGLLPLPVRAIAVGGARSFHSAIQALLSPVAFGSCPHRARRAVESCAEGKPNLSATAESPTAEAGRPADADHDPEASLPQRAHLAQCILGDGQQLRVRDNVFSCEALANVVDEVRKSTYFGENAGENDFYRGTFGFHVKFRDTYRNLVEEHFPYLAPLMQQLIRPECNCFFMNVFFARADGQEYHIDNYFSDYCGTFRPTDFVTVAYLSSSESIQGGELVVLDAKQEDVSAAPPRRQEDSAKLSVLARIRPRVGRVVDFDGRLLHAVQPFTSAKPRVSLVLEQCKLSRRHFMRVPKCTVYSQRTGRDVDVS